MRSTRALRSPPLLFVVDRRLARSGWPLFGRGHKGAENGFPTRCIAARLWAHLVPLRFAERLPAAMFDSDAGQGGAERDKRELHLGGGGRPGPGHEEAMGRVPTENLAPDHDRAILPDFGDPSAQTLLDQDISD